MILFHSQFSFFFFRLFSFRSQFVFPFFFFMFLMTIFWLFRIIIIFYIYSRVRQFIFEHREQKSSQIVSHPHAHMCLCLPGHTDRNRKKKKREKNRDLCACERAHLSSVHAQIDPGQREHNFRLLCRVEMSILWNMKRIRSAHIRRDNGILILLRSNVLCVVWPHCPSVYNTRGSKGSLNRIIWCSFFCLLRLLAARSICCLSFAERASIVQVGKWYWDRKTRAK